MQGAVDDDRLQFWQFLVTIALLSVAGLSVVTVVQRGGLPGEWPDADAHRTRVALISGEYQDGYQS